MGCWNGTCMLSNLPIFHGEDIKLLVMANGNGGRRASFCHPFEYHKVFPIILNAKYDDYGRGEEIEEELGTFVLNEIEQGIDWETFFEKIHRETLPVKTWEEETTVNFAMIRSDVFDQIISSVSIERFGHGLNSNLTLADITMIGYRYIQELKEIYNSDENENTEWFMKAMLLRDQNYFSRSIRYQDTLFVGKPMILTIDEAIRSEDMEFAKTLVEKGAEMLCFINFLEVGRMSFAIPSGAGSQDESTKYQRLLAQTTLAVADTIDNRWDEESGEVMRFNTLEDFLEHSCGMAPKVLADHFEEHREFIERALASYKEIESDSQYESLLEDMWLTLPEPPNEFYYNSGTP